MIINKKIPQVIDLDITNLDHFLLIIVTLEGGTKKIITYIK